MTDARVFVSIDYLHDDLVAPVKRVIDTWAGDRPHLTDLEVVRWTAPAVGDDTMNIDRQATWTGGLYLHSTEVTVGDIAAIREALAPYAATKVSALQDSARS